MVAHDIAVAVAAGAAAAIQKGYAWNDVPPPTNDPQFPEVPT